MNARTILEEVRAEERKRFEDNRFKPLPATEEAEFRKWKVTRYTEAIRLDPSLPEVYVARGTELYFLRRRAEAQADMRKAYALRPRDAQLYWSMSLPFEGDARRDLLRVGMRLADRSSLEYEQMRSNFIRSHWYDGNFREYVRLLEKWVPQLDPNEFMHGHEVQNLAQGYSALGEYEKAEAAYRRALSVSAGEEQARIAEMILRTLMHRGKYSEAREALVQLEPHVPPAKITVFNAALLVLSDPRSPDSAAASSAALAVAEPIGRAPGPLDNTTSYYSFLLGLLYKGAGRDDEAEEILERFARESSANKREWSITLRWEIATAREIARED